MDKISLIPVSDFIDIYAIFKDINKWPKSAFDSVVSYSRTVSLFRILIEDIVEEADEVSQILGSILKLTLDRRTFMLILVTSSMSSMYNQDNFHMFESEFTYFLQLRTSYLDRYNESFEKMAYHIIQGRDAQAEMIRDNLNFRKKGHMQMINTPMLVNGERMPC